MSQSDMPLTIEEIQQVVSLSRSWADRTPDRILLGCSHLPLHLKRQIALQVDLLAKMRQKIPHFLEVGGYIPARVNYEQCSSEMAAAYKGRFIRPDDCLCDLSGGLGMDSVALGSIARSGDIYELSPVTAQALTYNLPLLLPSSANLQVYCLDGQQRLMDHLELLTHYTFIYSDPARRNMVAPEQRVVCMADYSPDPLLLAQHLEAHHYGGRLLIKLSPMLDIHWLLETFGRRVRELHILQIRDEVKELLLFLDYTSPPTTSSGTEIIVAHPDDHGARAFAWRYEYRVACEASASYASQVSSFLYLPAPAVMKSGAFHLLALEQGVLPLSPNSHIYTSAELCPSFPGRTYRLVDLIPYSKAGVRQVRRQYPDLSIMTRHFPLSAQELKRQLGSRESQTQYLLATTLMDGSKILLVLEPVG